MYKQDAGGGEIIPVKVLLLKVPDTQFKNTAGMVDIRETLETISPEENVHIKVVWKVELNFPRTKRRSKIANARDPVDAVVPLNCIKLVTTPFFTASRVQERESDVNGLNAPKNEQLTSIQDSIATEGGGERKKTCELLLGSII